MELMNLIEQGNQELEAVTEFAADVMNSLDNDGDGEISREEFASALQHDHTVMAAFAQAMSISVRAHLTRAYLVPLPGNCTATPTPFCGSDSIWGPAVRSATLHAACML